MQSGDTLPKAEHDKAMKIYLESLENTLQTVEELNELNIHKEVINRLLEPYSFIKTIISSTEWSNFFALRCHKDADPAVEKIATMIKDKVDNSTPTLLDYGQWHLPYIEPEDIERLGNDLFKLQVTSVARVARVCYFGFDKKPTTYEQDLSTYKLLTESSPMHASPLESIATPDHKFVTGKYEYPELHGNFNGWVQYRKLLNNECNS